LLCESFMWGAASACTKGGGACRSPTPKASDRVKIILVEWAAYPLYRNKWVDGRVVRCGLGRLLDALSRHDPGVDIELMIVINGIEAPALSDASGGPLLAPLRRLAERQRRRRAARRLETYARLPQRHPLISAIHFRSNRGHDWGAYDFGYQLLREQTWKGDVLFMNSSVAGPHEHGWLLKYRGQFRRHANVGLCGISLNSHDTSTEKGPFAPHVQSYFLYTNMRVLSHALGARLLDTDPRDDLEVIRQGEIGVSERVLDAGYSITSPAFPDFAYRRGDPWAIPWGDLRYCRRLDLPINTI